MSKDEKAKLSCRVGADELFLYTERIDITANIKDLTDGGGRRCSVRRCRQGLLQYLVRVDQTLGLDVALRWSFGSDAAVQHPPPELLGRNLAAPSVVTQFGSKSEERPNLSAMPLNGIEHGWLYFPGPESFAYAHASDTYRALENRETTDNIALIA